MIVTVVDGDLLDQDVEVIVNAWNRNIIPWWLLIPQGVSGAIRKRGGREPFRELGRMGAIPLGHAVETSAGTLPFKSIIHVAGINMLWRSSERSIRDSVRNAISLARERGYKSIALPLIGAGSGGGKSTKVQSIIEDELTKCQFDGEARIVRYAKTPTNNAMNRSARKAVS
jgi:O-acetyl-ADP-ribose deacetylase (regulator of RNase III)